MVNTHIESEDHPWMINIADHPKRTDSPEYKKSRALMQKIVMSIPTFFYSMPGHER